MPFKQLFAVSMYWGLKPPVSQEVGSFYNLTEELRHQGVTPEFPQQSTGGLNPEWQWSTEQLLDLKEVPFNGAVNAVTWSPYRKWKPCSQHVGHFKVYILFSTTTHFLSTLTYAQSQSSPRVETALLHYGFSPQNGSRRSRFPSGTNFLMLQSPRAWLPPRETPHEWQTISSLVQSEPRFWLRAAACSPKRRLLCWQLTN